MCGRDCDESLGGGAAVDLRWNLARLIPRSCRDPRDLWSENVLLDPRFGAWASEDPANGFLSCSCCIFCFRVDLMSAKGEEYDDGDWEDGGGGGWEGFSADWGGGSDEELEKKRVRDGFDWSLRWRLARRDAMVVAALKDLGLWMMMTTIMDLQWIRFNWNEMFKTFPGLVWVRNLFRRCLINRIVFWNETTFRVRWRPIYMWVKPIGLLLFSI